MSKHIAGARFQDPRGRVYLLAKDWGDTAVLSVYVGDDQGRAPVGLDLADAKKLRAWLDAWIKARGEA